jgi:hypothetical protein
MVRFWCYIEGQSDYFSTSISPDKLIDDLKKQIYTEQQMRFIVQCTPANLTLTKVCYHDLYVNITVIMNGLCWLMTSTGRCGFRYG